MNENEQNLTKLVSSMEEAEKKWTEHSDNNAQMLKEEDEKDIAKRNKLVKLITNIGIVLAVFCVIGFLYLLITRIMFKKDVIEEPIPTVNIMHIKNGTIGNNFSVAGNILPNSIYYVPAKISGDIKKVYVKNGDYVKEGDPIVDLDCDKEIEAAFIQYDTARKTYERMQKLYAAGDISKQNYEQVKAQYDGAKLAYDTKVEFSHVVATADGKIEQVNMTENTSIKEEHVFCYITTDNVNEINFSVTERVLQGIALNDKVSVERNNKKYDGYISNISTLVNQNTGLFDIKAVMKTDDIIPSGSIAKVNFSYEKKDNVNILPSGIIYYENGIPYVYVVDNENIVHKTYIKIGIENENECEIISGVGKLDNVVSTWSKDFADGVKVIVEGESK